MTALIDAPASDVATADAPIAMVMPIERVEARMVELASQIAGATCELLCLVAQFDAAKGAKSWGLKSTAHWLSWKCGLGMTAAREQVRVARKLVVFPTLVGEFQAGRLSYSKVRSITRIATEATVGTWISWAKQSTAAELDRIVSGARKVGESEDAQAQRASRRVSYRWDEDGTLVGSFRLPPEDGAKLIAALEAAKSVMPDRVEDAIAVEDEATPACATCVQASVDRHAEAPCELIGEHDCDRMAAHAAQSNCADASAEALAERRPTKLTADALTFLVDRAAEWMRAHPGGDVAGLPGIDAADRFQLVIHAAAEAPAAGDLFDNARIDNGPRLHPDTARRLACSCPYAIQTEDANGNPLHLGRKARRARGRLARAVHHRDGGRCQAPGCTNRTSVIHHIIYWTNGGETCIENLISLCDAHHWLVHEGGWTITTLAPGRWLFQRADGSAVPHVVGAPIHVAPLPHNPGIDADAISGQWNSAESVSDAVWWMANVGKRLSDRHAESVQSRTEAATSSLR